jgi:adenine-specific DNA methylase
MTTTHECDWCEKEFEWDDDDVIESWDEDMGSNFFTRWEVVCPHCGETTTVTCF